MWSRPDPSPRWDLLEDAFDEARYQWMQRESFLNSAELSPGQVAELHEERLRASVDMLVYSHQQVSERLLSPNLQEDDRERMAVATLALLGRGGPEEVATVVKKLRASTPEVRGWIVEALALSENRSLTSHLVALLGAKEEPAIQASVLEALTLLGQSPGGTLLTEALGHPESEMRLAALRAARRWPWEAEAGRVKQELGAGAPSLRAAALEAGLVQGQRAVWRACQTAAEAPDAVGRTARLLLALGGEQEDVARLVEFLDVPLLRRDTMWALGFSGREVAANACLEWMDDPLLGGLAAEAFCAITGLKLEGGFARERPADDAIPPLEEDLRTPLLPGLDDTLPLARASAVEKWWGEARKNFEKGTRTLGGKPFTVTGLLEALERVPMRRRPPLALELAIRTGGLHPVETRTWVHAQRRQLVDARGWKGGSTLRPFANWMSH
ncbi:TIGR02270 family protein [Cystobacter ferrugineus]|uniref:TIGR02270 family protein n=1 Tax=Cystobacter ferrugineus TaxID=83449 RepID=A0A1L9BAE2_9BACT|nr:TIGR02270 family protein [Cystobacter ferrugineus]OJH39237.1 hypothetical protein BON30_17055 [Cystobacter ferrugineus]